MFSPDSPITPCIPLITWTESRQQINSNIDGLLTTYTTLDWGNHRPHTVTHWHTPTHSVTLQILTTEARRSLENAYDNVFAHRPWTQMSKLTPSNSCRPRLTTGQHMVSKAQTDIPWKNLPLSAYDLDLWPFDLESNPKRGPCLIYNVWNLWSIWVERNSRNSDDIHTDSAIT